MAFIEIQSVHLYRAIYERDIHYPPNNSFPRKRFAKTGLES